MLLRFVAVIFAGMLLTLGASGQALDEYQVKAAFLYNFAKFVEWPPEAFKTAKDPILVCVLGRNPFGKALEEAIRGKSIAGRAFAYRHVSDAESASACQILFCRLGGKQTLPVAPREFETYGHPDGWRKRKVSPPMAE